MQISIIARTAAPARQTIEIRRPLRLSRSHRWHLAGVLSLLGSSAAYAVYALLYSLAA